MLNPQEFTIIQDTREKKPLTFNTGSLIKNVLMKKLDTGDYTVEGMETLLFIERKASVHELFMTLGTNWNRFLKEMERAKDYKYKHLIIECTLREIYRGSFYSKMSGEFIVRRLLELAYRYGIMIHYIGTGHHTSNYMVKLMQMAIMSESDFYYA